MVSIHFETAKRIQQMLQYDLNQLGSDDFERLSQSLLKEIIGNGTITFGAGKDGAREATFKGKAPYPSESDQWDGNWIFQVKFHDVQLLGVDKARKQVISDLKKELDKIINKYRHSCDNYILITNVPFSSVFQSGTHDQLTKIVNDFTPPILNIAVWGADDLIGFIQKYTAIRNAFPQFLTPNDVIAAKNKPETANNTELSATNIPDTPVIEIKRDASVNYIARKFNSDCQKQIVAGPPQTGKTNLLSQFVRQHSDRTISYFITPSPLTQEQYTFLFSLSKEISRLLGKPLPNYDIKLESLKNLFSELWNSLHRRAKSRKVHYYLLIDGLEWGLIGKEGSRISDLFPLQTFSDSPYLLLSCNADKVDALSDYREYQKIESESWLFNHSETKEYFRDVPNLSPEEINKIHHKYGGIPGYLKIVKNAVLTNLNFELDSAPDDLNTLIEQQVEFVFKSSNSVTLCALKLLAVSPVPLLANMLAEMTNKDVDSLVDELKRTELIRYDSGRDRLEYVDELTKEFSKLSIGDERQSIISQLLDHVKNKATGEDTLIDLLLIEVGDYDGLKSRLTIPAIIKTVSDSSTGISGIIKRFQAASEMAHQKNDTDGLMKWMIGINVAKSFVSHAINQAEISALIAIGESQEALRKAYALPEVTTMIRLLARTYSSIKERGNTVPNDAQDSLKTMVENLRIKEIDEEITQGIALDLFPILPDTAISLLEKVIKQTEKQDIVESAIEILSENIQEQKREEMHLAVKDKIHTGKFVRLISRRLNKLSFEKLVKELKSIENTKAKEYIIREWCRQNPENEKIVQAIFLWQDTIISDRKFVIPLRSLRHISDLIIKLSLSVEDKKSLINVLKIPELISIDSPKEEWVRVRLNLSEALFEFDPKSSTAEIEEVYENVLQTVIELDEKTYCLARLLLTVSRIMPENKSFINTLEIKFQQAFDSLRKDSAYQFELTRGVIQTLVERDPNEALIVATELNTQERKIKAVLLVLHTALRTQGEADISKLIKDSLDLLDEFDESQRDECLVNTIRESASRERVLARMNLDTLFELSKEIKDPTLKSMALGNLAVLYERYSTADALKTAELSILAWKDESDLKIRLLWGYDLVESMSKIDLDRAKSFFEEVHALHLLPSSTLAAGSLGSMFKEILDLAIRSIDIKTFGDSDENIRAVEHFIQRIPAKTIQLDLYARLAASAYRSGYSPYADEVIRTKIIPEIKKMSIGNDRFSALEFSLPVIFHYDQAAAKELIQDMSVSQKNRAWYSVVLWSLCQSYLGDHEYINVEKMRVVSDFRTFKNVVIEAAAQINHDQALYFSIVAITNSIEASFDNDSIDQAQVYELMRMLDELSCKNLPDQRNIQHEGYLISALAATHGLRSYVYRSLEKAKGKSPRGITRQSIRREWEEIISKAKKIPNAADRIFVLAIVAKYARNYYDKDPEPAKKLLRQADEQIQDIPTLIDRISRLKIIGESWGDLKDKKQAEYLIQKAVESAKLLNGLSADLRLKTLVQAANKISPNFADKIVSELDKNRYPGHEYNPANLRLQMERLIANPTKLNLLGPKYARENVLGESSKELISNLVSGRENPIDKPTIEKWLLEGMQYHPRVSIDVAHWAVENLHRKHKQTSINQIKINVFLEAAELVYQLAEYILPIARLGMPKSVQESFPILNQKIIVFQAGDVEYARKWLRSWLSENVKNYLKICDPYFRKNELDYFKYLPENCYVLVITTDKYFDIKEGSNHLCEELKLHWQTISSRSLPRVNFLIFPKAFEDKFHDRAIVSLNAGLNIGQSLNGLGKSRGSINVLTEEEAKELESTYLQSLLNSGSWFTDHGVVPTSFLLSD